MKKQLDPKIRFHIGNFEITRDFLNELGVSLKLRDFGVTKPARDWETGVDSREDVAEEETLFFAPLINLTV